MRSAEFISLSFALASLAGCAGQAPPPPTPRTAQAEPPPGPAIGFSPEQRADASGSCVSPTWDITYAIKGKMMVTGTPLGFADTEFPIGPGTLTIRFGDVNGSPTPSPIALLAYEMRIQSTTSTAGLKVDTDMTTRGGPDRCGIASGSLSGSTLRWDECTYGPTNGVDEMSWTPENAASGPGCINHYTSKGTIRCTDDSLFASCSMGNLKDGENTQDEVWNQPLNSFVFSQDLKSFKMRGEGGPVLKNQKPPPEGGVETTDRAASFTWFNLDGTETGRVKSCACP